MARKKAGASVDAPVFFGHAGPPRWGLCCQFLDSPVKFRQATHKYVATLSAGARKAYLSDIVLSNANALYDAVVSCSELGIGAFRINSQLMPLATHPVSGYRIEDLDGSHDIIHAFDRAREAAKTHDIRLSFHPDQFVVLNSESEAVVASSVREMTHQAEVALITGAEALTLHGGGRVGGVEAAIERLERGVDKLGADARALLVLENDDRLFTPAELLPFCERAGIPFVYDVHHHRCNPDGVAVGETTQRAFGTWRGREPWTHISSPREGWASTNPRTHSGYVDEHDVPAEWTGHRMTIDVEAKEKERAVIAIMNAMNEKWTR